MDSKDYVEMKGCEQLLENIEAGAISWATNQDEVKIIKEFLHHRWDDLKKQT